MSYEAIIDYETGHLQIVSSAYWEEEEKLPLDNLIPLNLLPSMNLRKWRAMWAAQLGSLSKQD